MPDAQKQDLEETVEQLQTSGILFCIEFVGSVAVEKSINALSAEKQAEVARACMRFVVRKASSINGLPNSEEDEMSQYVHGPVLAHKRDVELNISSSAIILIDTNSFPPLPLHRFRIQDVSLLSPGFDELVSFFCFFAKVQVPGQPHQWQRRCFVFNAHSEMKDIRDTICFAFRLNDYNNVCKKSSEDNTGTGSLPIDCANRDEAATPIPPATPPTPVCREELASPSTSSPTIPKIHVINGDWVPEVPPRPRRYTSGGANESDAGRKGSVGGGGLTAVQRQGRSGTMESTASAGPRSNSISPRDDISVQVSPTLYKELTRGLNDQNWFHGVLPRMMADSLISRNGQFLVRQSPNIDGQFVLVGMHDKKVKHVCLIGKDGKIQTTIGEFRSIVHLIKYFHDSRQPLMLHGEQLVLHCPIGKER